MPKAEQNQEIPRAQIWNELPQHTAADVAAGLKANGWPVGGPNSKGFYSTTDRLCHKGTSDTALQFSDYGGGLAVHCFGKAQCESGDAFIKLLTASGLKAEPEPSVKAGKVHNLTGGAICLACGKIITSAEAERFGGRHAYCQPRCPVHHQPYIQQSQSGMAYHIAADGLDACCVDERVRDLATGRDLGSLQERAQYGVCWLTGLAIEPGGACPDCVDVGFEDCGPETAWPAAA